MLRLAGGLVAELTFSRGRSAPQRVVQLQWRRLLNRSSLKTRRERRRGIGAARRGDAGRRR